MRYLALAALCLFPALAQSKQSAFDKNALEAYLRHLMPIPAQVNVTVSDPQPSQLPGFQQVTVHQSYQQFTRDDIMYVSKDGQKIVRGSVYDINQNPFQPELAKIKTDLSPSFGTPGAPAVLVVFSDFECPYCKEEAKVLRKELPEKYGKDVRVYFKDFPLEPIHPWAKPAAIAGRCVFRQNPAAFWDFHDWIFEHQTEITAETLQSKVLAFGKDKNLDTLQLGRCMQTKATESEVDRTIAEGKALQVDQTPTLFLNGRRLVGIPWENLQQFMDIELNYQQKEHNAGEKCCEVKIPSPNNR